MDKRLFSSPGSSEKSSQPSWAPLADSMRPQRLEEVLGQDHLVGEGKILREVIHSEEIPSMIFWGPPGSGKTTLAEIIAGETRSYFVSLSAVLAGIKEVRKIVEEANTQRRAFGRPTILFIDEIHRFNKAQQDVFLPHVEKGVITLIGATTENPSFEIISPLLSRSRVLVLHPLSDSQVVEILQRALADSKKGLGLWDLQFTQELLTQLAVFANGDARIALNSLQMVAHLARRRAPGQPVITAELVEEALQKRTYRYDKTGEEHYNLISALHKSLRNSDIDASLYWLGRMLEAGEDPLYIARRLVRFASEDIGLADPAALGYAVDTVEAVNFIGLPEGKLALAQLAIYLAQAPKSNTVYEAYTRVKQDVEKTRNEPVPLALRNAPTALMKDLGYGKGYRYSHHEENRVADLECLPKNLAGSTYYRPIGEGFEKQIRDRLEKRKRHLDQAKKKKQFR